MKLTESSSILKLDFSIIIIVLDLSGDNSK